MKKVFIKKGVLLLMISGVLFTSCYKKYDPKTYQPAFTVNGYTSSSEIGAGSLVSYWAFDGSYIDSVSQTAATGVNTSFSGGFKGQALQGSDKGYAISDLPNAIKNVNSFTIDFWLKTPNTSGIITPISISRSDQDWGSLDMFYEDGATRTDATANLKVHFNGQSEVWFTNGFISNPWSGWVNIALTYDAASSTFTLYQGGNEVANQKVTGLGNLAFPNTANKIIFGTEQFQTTPVIGTFSPQSWAGYLTGQLDEVRIYNKALTASDLQALMVLQGKGK